MKAYRVISSESRRIVGPAAVLLLAILRGATAQACVPAMSEDRTSSTGTDPELIESVSVTARTPESERHSYLRISATGIGALYRAVREPTQGLAILLPVPRNDPAGAYADASRDCHITLYTTGESLPCP